MHTVLGTVHALLGTYSEALEHCQVAWSLLDSDERPDVLSNKAALCYKIGRIYEQRGGHANFLLALEQCELGLSLLGDANTPETARLYVLSGIANLRLGRLEQSRIASQKVLDIANKIQVLAEQARAHIMLGAYYRHAGDAEKAARHWHASARLYEQLPDVLGASKAYSNLGVAAFETGHWQEAKSMYTKALGFLKQAGDRYQIAMTCGNLADVHCHLGEIAHGVQFAEMALRMFTTIEARQGEIFARTVLATLYVRQEQLEDAHKQLVQAQTLIEHPPENDFTATVKRWLAEVYVAQGDLDKAEAEVESALALPDAITALEKVALYRIQGRVLIEHAHYTAAQEALQKALEQAQEASDRYELGLTLAGQAQLAVRTGNVTEAREILTRAREIFSDLGARLDLQRTDDLIENLSPK